MPHCPSKSRSRSRSRDRSTDEPTISIVDAADHDAPTDCETQQTNLDAKKGLVHGVKDFLGERLHFLQIGLGTYGTFAHHFAELEETPTGAIAWIAEHLSNTSTSVRGVGVEPVPEHLNKLLPALKLLPNASLVRAAVSSQNKESEVYTVTAEAYAKVLAKIPEDQREDFEFRMGYLRNMSCVGQKHPCFEKLGEQFFKDYDFKIDVEPVGTHFVTYGDLCRLLNFRGVEAFVVDAEGYDEDILGSMIDYCVKHDDAWPDFIQFESMWDNELSLASVANCQRDVVAELEQHGYFTIEIGHDTQMMRRAAMDREPRLQRWIEAFGCMACNSMGEECMPFGYIGDFCDTACTGCGNFWSGYGARYEDWVRLPAHATENSECSGSGGKLVRLATDGKTVFGWSDGGALYSYADPGWECLGDKQGLQSLAISGLGRFAVAVDDKQVAWRSDMQAKPWQWTRVATDFPVSRVALSLVGDTMCALSTDKTVYEGNPSQTESLSTGWGLFEELAMSSSAADVWAVNSDGEVYHREGQQGMWYFEYSPQMHRLAVSGDGKHVWGVSVSNRLFYRRWENTWDVVPGFVTDVAVKYDGSAIWILDGNGSVWACPLWIY